MAAQETTRRCRRCTDREAVLKIRTDHVCSECYSRFIATKTVKRLEVLNRETRGAALRHRQRAGWRATSSKTFLVGLSFGPSSAALVAICEQIILGQLAKGRDAAFTLHVVHVDMALVGDADDGTLPPAQALLDHWRARFPRFVFERVPLAEALALDLDWSLLRGGAQDPLPLDCPPATRLAAILAAFPSASSRRDVLDILVRRLLLARTEAAGYYALLLGCTTTALAERALAQTAKGRGFSLPWQLHDGPAVVSASSSSSSSSSSTDTPDAGMLLYYPLRELFRKEVVTYAGLDEPALADLVFPPLSASPAAAASVVSHKHLSIEDVMSRYFAEVEESYPSVVANVVKTAMKLERRQGNDGSEACGTCGMPLDDLGNERWKGEIGEMSEGSIDAVRGSRRLCYGCERTARG